MRTPEERQAMQALRQIVTVPETRELRVQLPDDAAPQAEAEVIVLFKSGGAEPDAKLAAMREAMNDELFLTDLRETMEDFRHADVEETPA
ncbi:MAG: hypothetical protein H7Y30_01975 [Pyrinomonadaceae bacterium]|nr:hypothetical protein [Pyrinomonadaceae bacterium]